MLGFIMINLMYPEVILVLFLSCIGFKHPEHGIISTSIIPPPIGKYPSRTVVYAKFTPIIFKRGIRQFFIESFGGLLLTSVPPFSVSNEVFLAKIKIGRRH